MTTPKKPEDQLINFAMTELNKMLVDLKNGKYPEMSNTMQKLSEELDMANAKRNKMSEEEIKQWAERVANEVSKLED